MGISYMTDVVDRVEFRKARQEACMTAEEVDVGAGWYKGTCNRFELDTRPMSDLDERKLLQFLQVVVAYECASHDYRSAVIAYLAQHGVTRNELARRAQVPEQVIRKLEAGEIKTRMREHNRKKLDAFFFAG